MTNRATAQEKSLSRLIRIIGFCLVLGAASPILPQTTASAPVVVVAPITIGRNGGGYRNPTIAVSPDGTVTVVAEAGPSDVRSLAAADLTPAGWTEPTLLEFAGPGDCRDPSMAYDSSGALHLAWSQKVGAAYAIQSACRWPDGRWRRPQFVSSTPDLHCDFAQVACSSDGSVWITWQAGRSTHCAVYLAARDEATSLVINLTGSQSDGYNLYPQLFPGTPYPVVWYEETEKNFRLRSVALTSSTISIISPLEFDRLDANQLPLLFQAPSGLLGGVWTDLVDGRVRMLIGFQGPQSRGEGLVAEATSVGDAAQPCAIAISDNIVALAWVSRLPTGSAVSLGSLEGISRVGSPLALPTVADSSFSRPRLAWGGGRLVHCVWFSDAARGGSGNLYYATLRF